MSTHKHFDRICCVVLAVTLLLTLLFLNAEAFGVQKADAVMGYERKLFDTSSVHTIDIVMDDWDAFLEDCQSEEYYACSIVIDGEAYKNVAIRGKGNTSLTQVSSYGNDRYSFKIEFDHYDSTKSYYGLDKLCLNNIIQDNTYMKDYLTYQLMAQMGVAAPLCSYVYITVNGQDWGLYLAVEGVEESFLQRNYGSNYGELYKPDSMSMGGGRGNGEAFDMDQFMEDFSSPSTEESTADTEKNRTDQAFPQMTEGTEVPAGMQEGMMQEGMMQEGMMQGGMMLPEQEGDLSNFNKNQGGRQLGGMMGGSDDVLLKYIDQNEASYTNIFDNAKTEVTDADKNRLIDALKRLSSEEDLPNTVQIEAVIRYFVVHNFVLNFDSYTGSMIHNYYLYEENGQLQMIPWDYNLAFGGFQSAGDATQLVNYPIDSPVSGGSTEDRPMIAWIFSNEEYLQMYHQYFAQFISQCFDSGNFTQMMDTVSEMIAPYVEKDPTKFCSYEEFEIGITTLKEFCLLRAQSVSGQLAGTIGATSDAQTDDTLVQAENLRISDMGSMDNTMGGGKQSPGAESSQNNAEDGRTQQFPWENGMEGAEQIPGQPGSGTGNRQDSNGAVQGDTAAEVPDGGALEIPDRGMQLPADLDGAGRPATGQTQAASSGFSAVLLYGCVLLLGLVFAWRFKRR